MRRRVSNALAMTGFMLCVYGMVGCAHDPAPVAVSPPAAAPVCIGVKTWSPAEERGLAYATAALPPDSPLIAALADYARMRKAARAACPTAK